MSRRTNAQLSAALENYETETPLQLIARGFRLLYSDVSTFLKKEVPLLIKDILWTWGKAKELFNSSKKLINSFSK